jgi:hypothetical protein
MKYSFREIGAILHIMHDETNEFAGYVLRLKNGRGFSVHRALTKTNEKGRIAVIRSIEEAIPVLAAYYEKTPPRWRRERETRFNWYDRSSTTFIAFYKWTFYGVLSVERQEPGQWIAYRNGDALERNGRDAIFKTPDEAKRAADAHMCDGFPNSETIHDGFSWELPCLIPITAQYPWTSHALMEG